MLSLGRDTFFFRLVMIVLIAIFQLLPHQQAFSNGPSLPVSKCWKKGTKSLINSYGAFGSADFDACARLLMREESFLSATVNTNTDVCYLSHSTELVTNVEESLWYANKACLESDDKVISGK